MIWKESGETGRLWRRTACKNHDIFLKPGTGASFDYSDAGLFSLPDRIYVSNSPWAEEPISVTDLQDVL